MGYDGKTHGGVPDMEVSKMIGSWWNLPLKFGWFEGRPKLLGNHRIWDMVGIIGIRGNQRGSNNSLFLPQGHDWVFVDTYRHSKKVMTGDCFLFFQHYSKSIWTRRCVFQVLIPPWQKDHQEMSEGAGWLVLATWDNCYLARWCVSLYTNAGWWLGHPSEKYMNVSWDDDIPNIWENKECSKPPTRMRSNVLNISIYYSCIGSLEQTDPLPHFLLAFMMAVTIKHGIYRWI